METTEEPIKPCPVCLAPNPVDAANCVECGAAFGTDSVLTPDLVISGFGPRWRRAGRKTEKPSRRQATAALGMVIFLNVPLFIGCAIMAIFCAVKREGFWDFAGFWLGIVLMFVAAKNAIDAENIRQ